MSFEATLTDEERDQWVDRMAHEVAKRGLHTPAVMFLEMHRPLAFLGSQALIVATPFLGAFVGTDNVLKLSKLVQDEKNVERLICRIEELAAARATGNPLPEPKERPADA